jgi:hypothetical protein
LDKLLECALTSNVEFEVGTRGLETDHLRNQVEIAKRTGSKLIRTIPEINGKPIEAADVPPHDLPASQGVRRQARLVHDGLYRRGNACVPGTGRYTVAAPDA